MTTYLLAGGGTAGHVNPLLAVADALTRRDPDATVLVLGTKEGLESRLVPERGYPLLTVDKVPFPRRVDRQAVGFPQRFAKAVRQVRAIIRERHVDVVIGFGGYAAAPAYRAARQERVPVVVHEANAKPGLANVLGARTAHGVGVAFAGTKLRGARTVGMPLRREVVELDRSGLRAEAARFFGLRADRPTLLVFGGSLGAQRLNDAIAGSWQAILDAGWQVLHVTGERSQDVDPGVEGYAMRRYVDRMDLAFALADFVVSRSGAATVSEISALALPAVYVPYAVGNGEQRLNAASAVEAGAALLIDNAEFTPETVRDAVVPLLGDAAQRERMQLAAERIGTRTGAENLIELVDAALGRRP